MARGRKPKVSDERLLLELLLNGSPVFSSEIEPDVDLGTQQIRDRLNDLAESQYVRKKTASGRNLYDLTDEGKDYISGLAREKIS